MSDNNKKKEYKNSLNLPKTSFPMRASLPQKEPLTLKTWQKKGLYQSIEKLWDKQNRKAFILHDGPPYANGDIHMGHALNKILKDFVVKYKNLKGFKVPFVPGWDCHGLPIEHQLLKNLGKTKHEVDPIEFRKKARNFALKWVKKQADQFQRLGCFGTWEEPYLTLNKNYEVAILEALQKIHENNHIYLSKRPVYWCCNCETALAEAEVEYQNHVSHQVFVPFNLVSKEDTFFVIWTTTPWTLPSNLAIAVHQDFEYVELQSENKNYIVAKELAASFIEQTELKDATIGDTVKGADLIGLEYHHCFLDRKSPVIHSEFVTLEAGTGLVHTAPGHGQEDYIVGLRNGIEAYSPVNEKGCYFHDLPFFGGESVQKVNPKVIELLEKKKSLLATSKLEHSYPHCWRCKNPIIFRSTEQWFISMDSHGVRNSALSGIKDVKWVPESGASRIKSMVEGRPDWCISRQRLWGVPIPSLKCNDCGESFISKELFDPLIKEVGKTGIGIWFEKKIDEIVGYSMNCTSCKSMNLKKEDHIVDVWFESGVSFMSVLKRLGCEDLVADLYLEGSDQHRGWFQSSLLAASSLGKKPPYEQVLTHGFVVDAHGGKMSKSLGNGVDPLEIMKVYGADILRLWVAGGDYSGDLKISNDHFAQVSDAYRKVRNSFRFILSNTDDFNLEKDSIPTDKLLEVDKWILALSNQVLFEVDNLLNEYKFYRAWKEILNFISVELSAVYFSVQKDNLYCNASNSDERRSCQTVLETILISWSKVLSIFIPYTSDEVWQIIIDKYDDFPESVFFTNWPENQITDDSKVILKVYADYSIVRDEVYKEIEKLISSKVIKEASQTRVLVSMPKSFSDRITNKSDLKKFIGCGDLEISIDETIKADSIDVKVSIKEGLKCERCWMTYSPETEGSSIPDLCHRCYNVVSLIGATDV